MKKSSEMLHLERVRESISVIMATILWEVGAFKISVERPFRLVSGNYSPIYVNCRTLISIPFSMDIVMAFMHWLITHYGIAADIIAGGETAGIPFASFLSQRLGKPMAYVRKRQKEHGISTAVEGLLAEGARVLLVEDLVTDGQSKLGFIQGIRDSGGEINTCLVIFDRGQGSSELLAKEGVTLYSLTDLNRTLQVVREMGTFSDIQFEEINQYLRYPAGWHACRDLPFK